jgi:hypothetical protein
MSHRRPLILSLATVVVLALGLLAGCGDSPSEDEQILATVGDREVDVAYYKDRLARLEEHELPRHSDGTPYDMTALEGKRAFLDVIIDKELMVLKAKELGFMKDSRIQMAYESLLEFNAMGWLWQDEIGDPSRFVSEEDVDYYYSRLGEKRECHFIICDLQSRAMEAVEKARGGMEWSEVVETYHDAPALPDRGDPVITVRWGQYRDEFEEPIFAVNEGEITEPIPTEHGWWVMRVDSVTMEEKPALESIKEQVLVSMSQRKETMRREALLEKLRQERGFRLNEEMLKVVFDGLPRGERIMDPETNQPRVQEELKELDVSSEYFNEELFSYDLSYKRVVMTVADFKAQFDRENVFERPKRSELLGGLRAKITDNAERAIVIDEAKQRGYLEDPRVIHETDRRIEKMLVDKVQQEVVKYEEYVSAEELEAFWADHHEDYANPERRAGQMVRCADLATAQKAREAIVSGDASWKTVNHEFGNDPQLREQFGRTPLVRIDAVGPVRDHLFSLEMDEVSEPFEVDGGWAVLQYNRFVEPSAPTLEEIREGVASRIRSRRMDEALRALIDDWMVEFPVTIDEELLAEMPSWEEARAESLDKKFEMPGQG